MSESVARSPLPILVFAWSYRSGPSRRMDSLVDHFVRAHRGIVRLARIDMETQPELAARLGITSAPTLLLLEHLSEVGRLEGRQALPEIQAMFEPLLGIEATQPTLSLLTA